jgi:predicted metal-dependent phosphoesterase TrpH
MRADLHIHTIASDGCWTPTEVVTRVRAAGIGLFAVSDHDALVSVGPTARLARQAGLAFLPAVEASALVDGTGVHVLAYGIDPADPALTELMEANTARLKWLNEETLRRLAGAGYPVDLEAYSDYRCSPTRGGWKALNFLIDGGLCRDVHDFFDRLFVDPVRPPQPDFPHPAEAAAVIRAAGGLPVLAHPGASLRGRDVDERTLAPFLEFGIAGLECYSSYHDAATTEACLAFCARHDLLVTGGSDSHGGFAGRRLGDPPIDTTDLRLGPLAEHVLR